MTQTAGLVKTSLLGDAFAHHAWATERLLAACSGLTREQLFSEVIGTYGPIIATLNHLVQSDAWYLFVLTDGKFPAIPDESKLGIDELRDAARANAGAWTEYLAADPNPEADNARYGDGWEYHVPVGVRLAQVVHHGTDHRSQVCTALTSLGIEPPEIDVWAYADATGRSREIGTPPQ
jgi:uncharacterized damage-inducible protein DinB